MDRKVLIVGATGFLGSTLLKSLHAEALFLDLKKPLTLEQRNSIRRASHVIICAAVTDVEKCAREPVLSREVNVTGTQALLSAILEAQAVPVFFSSDYVFNGSTPHPEDSPREPTTEYGRQKLAVENRIESDFEKYLIFRTSKLLAKFAHPRNLLFPLAQSLAYRKRVPCFEDQWLNPVFIEDISEILNSCIENNLCGVFHLGTERIFNRVELAQTMARLLGFSPEFIESTRVSTAGFLEARPTYHVLNCEKITAALGFKFCEVEQAKFDFGVF